MKLTTAIAVILASTSLVACGPASMNTNKRDKPGSDSTKSAPADDIKPEQAKVETTEVEVPLTPQELTVVRKKMEAAPQPAPHEPMKTEDVKTAGKIADAIGTAVGLGSGNVGTYVMLGIKAWELVQANKAVVDIETQKVSVLPGNKELWPSMSNWQGPAAKTFEVNIKSLLLRGYWKHVSQKYTIVGTYGGQLNGKGAYLKDVTILPDVSAMPGWQLVSKVEVNEPVNMGTPENPLMALEIEVHWVATSKLGQRFEGRETFVIKGDGTIVQAGK